MKVGLFFGSFNPIHIGHLIIANYVNDSIVDKIWFVVSPQSPFKQAPDLLRADYRLNLVKLAIQDNDRFEVSDIEFQLSMPSYTINTLKIMSTAYKHHEFYILTGSDNFSTISQWKSANEIITNYKILVYERPGFPIAKENSTHNNITFLEAPLLHISSTIIREMISKNLSVRYLVPEKVYSEINLKKYYSIT